MASYIPSTKEERLEMLAADVASFYVQQPNFYGQFEEAEELGKLVHEVGGQCYYDGANLNAVMGVVRPGDMGFDCIHSNLHKTFATPHGGGGTEIFRQCLL